MPQLVDACARNGFHEEALELASFVNSLERKHILATEVQADAKRHYSGSSSMIQSIVDDVQHTLVDLRQQLFLSLTESCSLPRQLYFLGILRKLDGLLIDRQLPLGLRDGVEEGSSGAAATAREYRSHIIRSTETRLQMDFLECRSIWLEKLSGSASQPLKSIAAMSSTDAWDDSTYNRSGARSGKADGLGHYGQAIELIEVNRTAWFEIITHFSALFHDTVGSVPSVSILSSWCWTQYRRFAADLFVIVSKIDDGPSLKSILEQCLLFATRMSSLGCDFTEDIISQFGDIILKRFETQCTSSQDRFETMLLTERYVTESDGVRREQVIPLYLHNSDKPSDFPTADAIGEDLAAKEENLPPEIIMNFPSLAHLTNGILAALNFVKDCPVLDIKEGVMSELVNVFQGVLQLIEKDSKRIAERGAKYNKIQYDKAASQKMDEILSLVCLNEIFPHLLNCFGKLYPTANFKTVQDVLTPLQNAHYKVYLRPTAAATVSHASIPVRLPQENGRSSPTASKLP